VVDNDIDILKLFGDSGRDRERHLLFLEELSLLKIEKIADDNLTRNKPISTHTPK
jgi:hypothetical protein